MLHLLCISQFCRILNFSVFFGPFPCNSAFCIFRIISHLHFSVFSVSAKSVSIHFLRNRKGCEGDELSCIDDTGALVRFARQSRTVEYSITPRSGCEGTLIQLTASDGIHKLQIFEGCVFTGQMHVMNRLADGVPLGMHLFRDSEVQFHFDLPDDVKALLTPIGIEE